MLFLEPLFRFLAQDWVAKAMENPPLTLTLIIAAVLAGVARWYPDITEFDNDLVYAAVFFLAAFGLFIAPYAPYPLPGSSDNPYDSVQTVEVETPSGEADFSVTISKNDIDECGSFCRRLNATARITNIGDRTAENARGKLTLRGKIGVKRTIWETTVEIGDLQPNETFTTTKQVTFVREDLVAVKGNGCAVDYELKISHRRDQWQYKDTNELNKTRCAVIGD